MDGQYKAYNLGKKDRMRTSTSRCNGAMKSECAAPLIGYKIRTDSVVHERKGIVGVRRGGGGCGERGLEVWRGNLDVNN